jgi:hypothetical protein
MCTARMCRALQTMCEQLNLRSVITSRPVVPVSDERLRNCDGCGLQTIFASVARKDGALCAKCEKQWFPNTPLCVCCREAFAAFPEEVRQFCDVCWLQTWQQNCSHLQSFPLITADSILPRHKSRLRHTSLGGGFVVTPYVSYGKLGAATPSWAVPAIWASNATIPLGHYVCK